MRLGSSARHTIWIFCFFVNFSKKSKNIVIENVSSFVSWDISFIWFQLVVLLFSQTITRLSIAVKICQKWSDDIINRRARWWLWWFPFVSQIWQVVYAQIRERERERTRHDADRWACKCRLSTSSSNQLRWDTEQIAGAWNCANIHRAVCARHRKMWIYIVNSCWQNRII